MHASSGIAPSSMLRKHSVGKSTNTAKHGLIALFSAMPIMLASQTPHSWKGLARAGLGPKISLTERRARRNFENILRAMQRSGDP